jgi:hypothetical protein
MKKFLVLYMMPAKEIKKMMAHMTPEAQKESMDGWTQWMNRYHDKFADPGAPAGKNTRVSRSNAQETPNEIIGYSIMQGSSKEEVVKALQASTHLSMPGSYTEVMECLEMPASAK